MKLISALTLMLLSCFAIAQDSNSPSIMYDLELIPTGSILNTCDTLFNVVLVIDEDDFKELKNVSLSDELISKVKSVKTNDPEKNTKITKKEDKFKIDMDEWSAYSKWEVIGEKKDGQKVLMKDRHGQSQNPHKVVARAQVTRNVKIDTLEPIIEPKPIPEPRPVEPDTISRRINLL